MSYRWRILGVGAGTAAAAALIVYYIVSFLVVTPPTIAATGSGRNVHLTIQTVPSFGHAPHVDWVTYMVRNPQGRWVHSTVWRLPAYATVTVTDYNFDTATGLRNPFWGRVQGTVGGTMSVDGKKVSELDPSVASHTFTVPELGVAVAFKGVPDNAKNQCSVTPCSLWQAHTTTVFTFKTGKPGKYRWQCFVPCAFGFIFGNGGPMQSLGWMDGYLMVH